MADSFLWISCRATLLTLLYSLRALPTMIIPLPTSLPPHDPTQMALLLRPTPALVALPKTVIETEQATRHGASPVKMITGQADEGAKTRMVESMQTWHIVLLADAVPLKTMQCVGRGTIILGLSLRCKTWLGDRVLLRATLQAIPMHRARLRRAV